MEKEIHEQPEVLGYTLAHYLNADRQAPAVPAMPFDPATLPRLTIIATGTSYYAAMVGKYWLENLAGVMVEVDIASEFRYREAALPAGGAAMFISQSGESLDTLMALRYARAGGQHILALVNQTESSIAREADLVLPTRAGPEISVASTKAFTTQLMALAVLAVDWRWRAAAWTLASPPPICARSANCRIWLAVCCANWRAITRSPTAWRRPATSCISAAALVIRSLWKAR